MMLRSAVGRRHVRQTSPKKKKKKKGKKRTESEQGYFVCIELTHVTIVKSPRDTWLLFRGVPVLCVIHVSTASVGVSEHKDEPFSFFMWILYASAQKTRSIA